MNTEGSKCKQERLRRRREQEPQNQLKRGRCDLLDAERDIRSVGVKVSGLERYLHVGKVFPFHIESEVSQQVQF